MLLALVTTALIAAIAGALIVTTSTDVMITGSYRASLEAMYAVEAGVERAAGDSAMVPDWSAVLAAPPSNVVASFDDGAATAAAPDGKLLSARADRGETDAEQSVYGPAEFGADSPVWRLYAARGTEDASCHLDSIAPPGYVLVWVADDGGDGDGDPARDSNGQLLVYGDAYERQGVAAVSRWRLPALRQPPFECCPGRTRDDCGGTFVPPDPSPEGLSRRNRATPSTSAI